MTAVVMGTAVLCAALGWGMFARWRHQLALAAQERRRLVTAEADLHKKLAQRTAREKTAREMHEALGNRLSLLTIHAGVLTLRPNTPPAQVEQSAEVIRESAHHALEDLREIIRVLHIPDEPCTSGHELDAVAFPDVSVEFPLVRHGLDVAVGESGRPVRSRRC